MSNRKCVRDKDQLRLAAGAGMPQFSTGIMEFHISRQARDSYSFDQLLFTLSGNVIFADLHAVRNFTQKINKKRDLIRFPEQAVRAGEINAMGLIDEILHYVVGLYRQTINPGLMEEALTWLDERIGTAALERTFAVFIEQFPPLAVYQGKISQEEYLGGRTGGMSNQQILLEEMLLLWLGNLNPAFAPYLELFDDTELEINSAYLLVMSGLGEFIKTQPSFGPDDQDLINFLRSPAIAVPHSLSGQLDYMRNKWGYLLGDYIFRLLRGLDLISEEEKAVFQGPGPSIVADFRGLDLEFERFSPDSDWMPSLVLMAKNIFVWLDQLSKTYQREITRLDQIPDEELDQLAGWGFNGLWLIGLWQRSSASQRIKQLRGNPEAVASAYSLFEYQIAAELGGDQAYYDLHSRAWQRGIRLASDMVPNHMGIDSRWVIEKPDWFISLDDPPFPSYSFNGVDLSWDDRVGLFIEDHYYDNSDAAVVFKRLDKWTGDTKYIYHGNDGTSMPWNDTAQLNYLSVEVRQAVIETILDVARKFPIIRFDAAMTLAKKHYQRLWYPEPGTGGAIPSRAENGLTRAQFEAVFPQEFWREVVDRVAEEVPDTLLLAEAFWLMEGYFVRTLGMHRVYNSAFMNMLRDEKNQEYRLVIKNTLEFDPEILKRYVNFMNNPDERTAADQFGKDDKYFGICTMMATMPGLPMFGHGQIEGFSEKYGMEFRRAYWEETPDQSLVERHRREIFPLLRKRYLFAEVAEFSLYDFFNDDGTVNEDVFAYSNRLGDERALVVYHNRFAEAKGWIRDSAAVALKSGEGEGRRLVRRNLSQGLGLNPGGNYFTIFRDQASGLQYVRSNHALDQEGLYLKLGAYRNHVFMDFQEVEDNEWGQYAQLASYLDGRGVPDIEETLKEIILQPVHFPFQELTNADVFKRLYSSRGADPDSVFNSALLAEVEEKTKNLLKEINNLTQSGRTEEELGEFGAETRRNVELLLQLPKIEEKAKREAKRNFKGAVNLILGNLGADGDLAKWVVLFSWVFTKDLGRIRGDSQANERSRSWIDEWLFGKLLQRSMNDLGMSSGESWNSLNLLKVLISHGKWPEMPAPKKRRAFMLFELLLEDEEVRNYLQVNRYQGVLWFNKESCEQLLAWLLTVSALDVLADTQLTEIQRVDKIADQYRVIRQLDKAKSQSDFQIEAMLEALIK